MMLEVPSAIRSENAGLTESNRSIKTPRTNQGKVEHERDGNQRPAVLAVGAFYLLGLFLLKGVSDEPVS